MPGAQRPVDGEGTDGRLDGARRAQRVPVVGLGAGHRDICAPGAEGQPQGPRLGRHRRAGSTRRAR